jgi:hypothetical protein
MDTRKMEQAKAKVKGGMIADKRQTFKRRDG